MTSTQIFYMDAGTCGVIFGSMIGTVVAWIFVTGILSACFVGIIKIFAEYKINHEKK